MPDYSYLRDLIELEDPDCRMKHALAAASTMMMQQPQGCSGLTLGASKPNAAPCMPAESGEPSGAHCIHGDLARGNPA